MKRLGPEQRASAGQHLKPPGLPGADSGTPALADRDDLQALPRRRSPIWSAPSEERPKNGFPRGLAETERAIARERGWTDDQAQPEPDLPPRPARRRHRRRGSPVAATRSRLSARLARDLAVLHAPAHPGRAAAHAVRTAAGGWQWARWRVCIAGIALWRGARPMSPLATESALAQFGCAATASLPGPPAGGLAPPGCVRPHLQQREGARESSTRASAAAESGASSKNPPGAGLFVPCGEPGLCRGGFGSTPLAHQAGGDYRVHHRQKRAARTIGIWSTCSGVSATARCPC